MTSLLDSVDSLGTRLLAVDLQRAFGRRTLFIGVAVCLTVLGGIVVWSSWSSTSAVSGEEASSAEGADRSPEATSTPSADDVTAVLEELCESRAAALSNGDEAALKALTVPESAAAAADELIDLSTYADSDYSIDVEDVVIVAADDDRVVASALMRSSGGTGADLVEFAEQTVEFELHRVEGAWLVAEVREATTR